MNIVSLGEQGKRILLLRNRIVYGTTTSSLSSVNVM